MLVLTQSVEPRPRTDRPLVPARVGCRDLLLGALVAAAAQPPAHAAAARGRHAPRSEIAAGDLTARCRCPRRDDELADLARSINSMADALERSKGLEQQFLLSVSHDLRTPLTSIQGLRRGDRRRHRARPAAARPR